MCFYINANDDILYNFTIRFAGKGSEFPFKNIIYQNLKRQKTEQC